MAARNQHVHDTAVAERRLRPIYEWLDSGNPKKALQETDKVLRKTPNLQCAKALKGLALLQLGRDAECVSILNCLTSETPSDTSTLQAMAICYRDLGQLEKVCQLYEKAVQADPTNEELHTHLFMSYVRTSNFKLQQQSAMALFKMKPKNPYYFWAVMSIVLQATRGPGASDLTKKNLLLSLAERMVDKLINDGKLEAEQEVQLYLMILELQGKYEQALQVLDGPLGAKLMTGSTDHNRIGYLVNLQQWTGLNSLCNELLTANMDRWDIWNHYLTSIFHLTAVKRHNDSCQTSTVTCQTPNDSCQSDSCQTTDDSIEKAHEFICFLIENISDDNLFKNSSSYQLRGPYLARFELYSRLKSLGKDPSVILGDICELFVEYFRLFGHKPCCVSDLRIYLNLLSNDRRRDLANRLLKDVGISAVTLPQSEKQMQRHICSLQLSRLCGNHARLDTKCVRILVVALSLHYDNGAREFGTVKLPTDQGPADAYILLAAHTLYDLARTCNTSVPVLEALALLEKLLKTSPSNFHAKLLCVRLYHALGGGDGAHKWFESLDTKHLQMDSLGFVHCARMHPTGLLALTTAIYDATLKFFSTNYRDSIDHLTFSYKFGSFLKLEEFMDFRERLNNSLHYTMTAIDRMLLEIVLCPNLKCLGIIDASPKNNNIDWDALRDNNDYGVFVSWDADRIGPQTDGTASTRQLFEQDRDLARIRAGILCCVSSGLDLLKVTNENREQSAKTLREVYRDWLTHWTNIEHRKEWGSGEVTSQLSQPLPSRLRQQLELPYRAVLGCLVRVVLGCFAHANTANNHGDGCPATNNEQNDELVTVTEHSFVEALNELVDRVSKVIGEQNDSEDPLWTRRTSLELVVNCVELLSVACVLCAVCWELIRPTQTTSSGRKGKKKTTPTTGATPQNAGHIPTLKQELSSCVSTLLGNCTAVEQALTSWRAPSTYRDICERFGEVAIAPGTTTCETQETVLKQMRTSHSVAMSDLRAALISKIKFLNTLTC